MSDSIDRSKVRTWRNVYPWPSGAVYDPDGNLLDGSFKRGVYELLDEIEKPESQRDRNRVQLALWQFAPGVLDRARACLKLDGGEDLAVRWLGSYDPRFLWISDDMKKELACVLADNGFLPSTFGNGPSKSEERGPKPGQYSVDQALYRQHESDDRLKRKEPLTDVAFDFRERRFGSIAEQHVFIPDKKKRGRPASTPLPDIWVANKTEYERLLDAALKDPAMIEILKKKLRVELRNVAPNTICPARAVTDFIRSKKREKMLVSPNTTEKL